MNRTKDFCLVSILMPAKNVESFIFNCIESILKQSYLHWELIIVDDHSEDATHQIIEEFSKKDIRIKILKNKGNGIIDALKLAYENAKGDYITRMDADDIMSKYKIEYLVTILESDKEINVSTGFVEYFTENGLGEGYKKYADWLNGLVINQNHFSEIYKECVVPSPCWMMRRVDFERIGGFENNIYPEDYDLCFRMYAHNMKVKGIQKVLHYWRDYSNRTSRTSENYANNSFLELKMHYFLKLDYDLNKELILLGAGKKGKKIAQILIDQKIPFRWLTNNQKKIGLNIYGVFLGNQSDITFSQNNQTIVAIANPTEQKEISTKIENSEVYWFC